ncbi:MAG: transcription factor S, partial [Gemmatimonadetes bacterium]|nr:transcription factor S [Gemmatimonadota bacterium]
MEFCEKCGGMIVPRENKIACASCGYKPKRRVKLKTSEKIDKKEPIVIVKEEH